MMEYPKLRPVEAIAAQQDLICLRDPLGFSDKLVFLHREAFFIVSLFDGRHSILDIQEQYTRRHGTILFSDKVREIIRQLDSCLLLDSEHFREARSQAIAEFRQAAARRPSHAGSAYEADAEALRRQLDALFAAPEGPGLPQVVDAGDAGGAGGTAGAAAGAGFQEGAAGGASGGVAGEAGATREPAGGAAATRKAAEGAGSSGETGRSTAAAWPPLRGLIAPHIDVRRGGRCFAFSYAELARWSAADTFVVLGIAHAPMRRRFALTAKSFETPLGPVPADQEFLAALTGRCGTDFFEDEFTHKNEHSVEFQALFLRYLYGEKRRVRLVPVLCGSFEAAAAAGLPEDEPEVREFITALESTLQQWDGRACCIAGVDLSHLGRRFGQELTMSPEVLATAEAEDRRMIQRVLERDAEGFFGLIQEEKDRRNVCGVPAIYTLLRVLGAAPSSPAAESRLLRYEQAVEQATQSVVTFMGASFFG